MKREQLKNDLVWKLDSRKQPLWEVWIRHSKDNFQDAMPDSTHEMMLMRYYIQMKTRGWTRTLTYDMIWIIKCMGQDWCHISNSSCSHSNRSLGINCESFVSIFIQNAFSDHIIQNPTTVSLSHTPPTAKHSMLAAHFSNAKAYWEWIENEIYRKS